MYLKYWGLKAAPFRQTLEPCLFFETPNHDEALSRMDFLVEGRRRCGLVVGTAGVGKSMLLEVAAARFRCTGHTVAQLSLLGVNADELLRSLVTHWGGMLAPRAEMSELWRVTQDRLAEFRLLGKHAVVLLDDADEASNEILAQVARFSQTDPALRPAATVILTARNENVGRLGTRLLELADLRIDLARWSSHNTARYLQQAVVRAGRIAPIFAPEACAKLHEYSHGVPRNLLQLADLSLVAGAAEQRAMIGAETIESVYYELGVVETLI